MYDQPEKTVLTSDDSQILEVHVNELVKSAWTAPNGRVLPDYVYPMVEHLKKMLDDNPDTRIYEIRSEGFLASSKTGQRVLRLLKHRLAYLNDGVPTSSLLVLPSEEYAIFSNYGITQFPVRRSKVGTAGQEEELRQEQKLITALWMQVCNAFAVTSFEEEKTDPKFLQTLKKKKRIDKAAITGSITVPVFGVSYLFISLFTTGATNIADQMEAWNVWAPHGVPTLIAIGVSVLFAFRTIDNGGVTKVEEDMRIEALRQEHEVQPTLVTSYLMHNTPSLDVKGSFRIVDEILGSKESK